MAEIELFGVNVRLRVWKDEDLKSLVKNADNKKIVRNTRNHFPNPYTEENGKWWIDQNKNQTTQTNLAIVVPSCLLSTSASVHSDRDKDTSATTGSKEIDAKQSHARESCNHETCVWEASGGISVFPLSDITENTVEVGYWVGEPYWGKGVASEALSLFEPYVWNLFPKAVRMEAAIFAWNPASAKVLKKNGFQFETRNKFRYTKNEVLVDALMFVKFRPGFDFAAVADPSSFAVSEFEQPASGNSGNSV